MKTSKKIRVPNNFNNMKRILYRTSILLLIYITFIFASKINAQPPLLEQWESNMTTWGEHWGQYLQTYDPPTNGGMDEANGIYYDAQRIYFQIADYTGQAEPWNTHAQEAERVYKAYLDNRRSPYSVQGYRRFPHGIRMDAQRTGDSVAVAGVLKLRDWGAFSNVLKIGKSVV